jgi:hypothetical protein
VAIWQSVKCALNFHTWDWRSAGIVADPCRQESRCGGCGKTRTRQNHSFGDWMTRPADPCVFVRSCPLCGLNERKESHEYGRPEFKSRNACERFEVCKRCDDRHDIEAYHDLQWVSARGTSCEQRLACSRCGTPAYGSRTFHAWSEWVEDYGQQVYIRTCRRCGVQEVD